MDSTLHQLVILPEATSHPSAFEERYSLHAEAATYSHGVAVLPSTTSLKSWVHDEAVNCTIPSMRRTWTEHGGHGFTDAVDDDVVLERGASDFTSAQEARSILKLLCDGSVCHETAVNN